jgi:hypothetical protein
VAMDIIYIICIIVFSIIWPVGMLVLNACRGDVRAARCIMEQERSEFLNITSGKIHSTFINTIISVRGTLVPITFKNPLSEAKPDSSISGHHYQYLDSVGSISENHYQIMDNKKLNEFNKR